MNTSKVKKALASADQLIKELVALGEHKTQGMALAVLALQELSCAVGELLPAEMIPEDKKANEPVICIAGSVRKISTSHYFVEGTSATLHVADWWPSGRPAVWKVFRRLAAGKLPAGLEGRQMLTSITGRKVCFTFGPGEYEIVVRDGEPHGWVADVDSIHLEVAGVQAVVVP